MPEKPLCDAPIIGANGNAFSVVGICVDTLRRNGYRAEAQELKRRAFSEAHSYDDLLNICMEYINPVEA